MVKRILVIFNISIFLTLFLYTRVMAKIAMVNISAIFQKLPQRILVAKQLESEFKDRFNELKNMERKLHDKIEKLQNNNQIINPYERNLIENQVIAERNLFSLKAQKFEHDNHRRQIEERNKLLNQIRSAIQKVADKEGYDIVIDSDAVAYIAKSVDITNDVLDRLNE